MEEQPIPEIGPNDVLVKIRKTSICGSRLKIAGHRKAHHAYALSASGMAKLYRCGFRDALLPYDDFLPSLHSTHPRPDLMANPCGCFIETSSHPIFRSPHPERSSSSTSALLAPSSNAERPRQPSMSRGRLATWPPSASRVTKHPAETSTAWVSSSAPW